MLLFPFTGCSVLPRALLALLKSGPVGSTPNDSLQSKTLAESKSISMQIDLSNYLGSSHHSRSSSVYFQENQVSRFIPRGIPRTRTSLVLPLIMSRQIE